MTPTKVYAKVEGFDGEVAGVTFTNGEGVAATQGALNYFIRAGYRIGETTSEVESPEPEESSEDLGSLTVAELKDLAEERGIDLTGAHLKAEIISAIESA